MSNAVAFICECEPATTGIAFHGDADGITGAALLAKTLRKLAKGSPREMMACSYNDPTLTSEIAGLIRDSATERLVAIDLAIQRKPQLISRLGRNLQILVVDHHDGRAGELEHLSYILRRQLQPPCAQRHKTRRLLCIEASL